MNKKSYWMSDQEYSLVTKKTPIPTVNLVILRKKGNLWEVLLIIRKSGYAKGNWCIIGGRVWINETLSQAIKRQAQDLGITVDFIPPFNSNFPSFIDDKNDQDETKHPISLVYPVRVIKGIIKKEGEEFSDYQWFSVSKLPHIAYGQKRQILKTIERIKML